MASTKTSPDISIGCNNRNGESKFDWQLLIATLACIAFYTVTFVEIARDIQCEEAIGLEKNQIVIAFFKC